MKTQKLNLSLDDFDVCAGNTFKDLLVQTEFADVTLVSDDLKQIKAHKVILSASSSKFKAMLQKAEKQEPFIYLTGVSYQEMQSMVHFMYLGQTEISQDDLAQFLNIAAKFDVKGLAEYDKQDNSHEEIEKHLNEVESVPSITENFVLCTTDNIAPLETTQKNFEVKKEETETNPETSFSKAKDLNCKWFYCEGCDYKTNRPHNLKVHRRAQHEGVKLSCDKCEMRFSYPGGLITHKKTKHSGILL